MLWGQFTFADVAGPGPFSAEPGWKVTTVEPANGPVDPARIERATASLSGFTPVELPLLATAAELDELPRRLRLHPIGPAETMLTQQSSCGYDDRHRPSWFAHGLLFGSTPGLTGVRPGDLWGVTDWLRPTDRTQVETARPGPGFDPTSRGPDRWTAPPDLIPLILSVWENGLGPGGPMSRIAVVDPNGQRTARWVRHLGQYISHGAAWSIPFSTFESGVIGVDGLRIAGIPIPRTDLGPEWVVIDPDRPPRWVPGPNAAWELDDGRRLPRGPWATFAGELAADLGVDRLRDLIDEQTGWAGTSADDRPLWALPAAVLLADSSLFSTRSPQRRAAAVLAASWWPERLAADPTRRATLSAVLARSHPEPFRVATMMLRSADREVDQVVGGLDDTLETYLDGLFTPSADGRGWVAGIGPLPWWPTRVRPGRELLDRWSSRWPTRIAAMVDPRDAVGLTRVLTVVVVLAEQWSGLDDPVVSMQVAPRLAGAMAETLLVGVPVVEGRWPLLPMVVANPVAGLLRRALEQSASRDPVVAALHWMDAQYGPIDVDDAGRRFPSGDALAVARIAALGIGGRPDRDVATIRTAQAVRRANRVPGLR